jgi:cobalt-precorrin-5B (C1)-methyltransferase
VSHADLDDEKPAGPLRRGWTTGTCATAAARAAYELLVTGQCPAMVEVALPGGERPCFPVAMSERTSAGATAGIVKDAGDDPDVTHGALVKTTLSAALAGSGLVFKAGQGVGTVTKPGLPIPPGEPAINPVPRRMIAAALAEAATLFRGPTDLVVEISIPGGDILARSTLNGRLGIVGGLSILGTTGVVVPYSCAAWIHSIHRGIDVARATGLDHVAGATGSSSEAAIQKLYGLPDGALLEMGNFAGGMLKYLKRQPVPRVTVAGGFAKMAKLAQGLLDLHSKRGTVDRDWLAGLLGDAEVELRKRIIEANTAQLALEEAHAAGLPLGDRVAEAAWETAAEALDGAPINLDVVIFDRAGGIAGRSAVRSAQSARPRNRR